MNRIYRRKADSTGTMEMDEQPQETEETEEEVDGIGEKVQHIGILLSRIADITHYRAFDDIDFMIGAIGAKEYAGSPNLDVLPSHEDIDRERRQSLKDYIYCLNCWLDGKDVEDAVGEYKANDKLVRNIYVRLGNFDEEKKWLAMNLVKMLEENVASPEDDILEISDEDFITYVYKTVLGRDPDPDDLRLRVMELKRGKERPDMIKDILESKESSRRMLAEIADSIKKSSAI